MILTGAHSAYLDITYLFQESVPVRASSRFKMQLVHGWQCVFLIWLINISRRIRGEHMILIVMYHLSTASGECKKVQLLA